MNNISIYKNNDWKSIKGQQAYVNGAWKTIGDGSGVYKDGNWYVFGKRPMILQYQKTTTYPETITLPLSGNSATPLNARVDWGDGSPVETVIANGPIHEYANSGVYEVKINGTVPRISSYGLVGLSGRYLTGIKSWGKLDGLTSMEYAFYDCYNLKGELPNDDYDCFENVTDFSYCFGYCTELTSLPENLFANCPNVTDFDNCFYGCTGLTSIPENLFSNCSKVTDFSFCFKRCKKLVTIPENLFTNCPNVTDFYGCFQECSGLTGSIPENLFSNCPNVTNFGWCFMLCSRLTGATPVDILEDGTRVELWERAGKLGYPTEIDGHHCFAGCSKLSNYSEIPKDWL